jgi:hypothetical protein
MMISSQPISRNFDKSGGKILCEKRTTKIEPHEKMGAKIILLDKRTMKAKTHEKMSGKVILS